MQFYLTLSTKNSAMLPLNYGHYVQSMIYKLIGAGSGGKYSGFVHDKGHTDGNKQFRMFTFSKLSGKFSIQDKTITFTSDIHLQIRSADDELCYSLRRGIEETDGLFLGKNDLVLKDYKTANNKILSPSVKVRTITPISVYITEPKGKRYFVSPDENDFERLIQANFSRKFKALYGIIPIDGISVSVLETGRREATFFGRENNGSWIFGWHGSFALAGNPQYLDFLYNTGLGSKNSQGFGMFEVI